MFRQAPARAPQDGSTTAAVLRDLRSPLAVYVPVALLLFGVSAFQAPVAAVALAAAGLLLWTLLEYLFHRFLLHLLPRGGARRLLAGRHLLHHKNPTGHPGIVLLWVSGLNGSIFLALLVAVLGLPHAAGLMAGTIAGYLFYEYLHLWTHTVSVPATRWGRFLRWHHLVHHGRSARTNFAVVLPLWDTVFGTAYRPLTRPDTPTPR